MKLIGTLMEFNELSRGNLHRCLQNLERYCDDIVVYDDGSADSSVQVAQQYTDHVIVSPTNDFENEIAHHQQLLDAANELGADYILRLDADEVMDHDATRGGLRELMETGDSFEFKEVTLWRSYFWRRVDYLGDGYFIRLYKNTGDLKIKPAQGLHQPSYPQGLNVKRAPFKVLHFGYIDQKSIERRWRERSRIGVPVGKRRLGVDEENMVLEPVPLGIYPDGVEIVYDNREPEPMRFADDIMKEAGL